jgi:hypothetical protein
MQAIRTRYIGPSNVRGSRIQAKCEARTLYMPYDHALNLEGNHAAACEALLLVMQWSPKRVGGVFAHDYYWISINDTQTGGA